MQGARENATPAIVNIAKSACATGVFVIRAFDDLHAVDVIATDRIRPKARRADSESRFLAMKKFSWLPASRLIAARQNPFFARIAAADSRCDFWSRDAA
jgi:hypothetical protein